MSWSLCFFEVIRCYLRAAVLHFFGGIVHSILNRSPGFGINLVETDLETL